MMTKLFVGGLSFDTTEDTLHKVFGDVGDVASVKIITDKFTGKSRGFAFVEMADEDGKHNAIEKLNGLTLDGRQITVSEAREKERRPEGGGGFRHRDGGGQRSGSFGQSRPSFRR